MGEHEAAVPGPGSERVTPEQAVIAHFPAPLALVRKSWMEWLRNLLYAVGLLLMGGGACTGVFCGLAFDQADQAWHTVWNYRDMINKFVGHPEVASVVFGGETLNEAGWRGKWAQAVLDAHHHEVRALVLLSVAIGLGLGGIVLCLLAWGLRPGLRFPASFSAARSSIQPL
jgi:hypothetical protein